jgi:hypothetical protein
MKTPRTGLDGCDAGRRYWVVGAGIMPPTIGPAAPPPRGDGVGRVDCGRDTEEVIASVPSPGAEGSAASEKRK